MSAFLVSVCMSAPSDGYIAMPIEAVVWHSWPLSCMGWLEHGQQLAGDAFDIVSFGGFLQDDDEFVAAEPRHDVARTQRARAAGAADFHQQHVAGIMAQRIVDDLEPVEIDEQQRKPPLIALRGVDRTAQQAVEHFPVGQVRQAVVRCQIFDPLVRPGLFVGAIEILQRKGDVVGQPLQQFGEFRRERVLFDRNEDHDADHLSVREQRKRRAGLRAVAARPGVERLAARVGQIIVDDAGLARAERHAADTAPFRLRLADRYPTSRALAAVGPAAATMSRYSLFGFTSAMVVEVNLPPLAAASHTSSNSSLRDFARMIASLVALSAASMRVRRSFCSSVLAFSSARSKFSERKGHVVGQPLQQFGEFRRERVDLGGDEQHHADGLPIDQQRKRGARPCAFVADDRQECRAARIVDEDRLRCWPAASGTQFRRARGLPEDRHWPTPLPAGIVRRRPCDGNHIKIVAVGPDKGDAGGVEPAALGRGLAHQFEQFGSRLGTDDRFIGRAQRREHAREAFFLLVGFRLFVGTLEIVERERHVLGDPRQQRDDLFIRGP